MLNKTKLVIAVASLVVTGVGAGTGAYIATRNNDTGASVSLEVISVTSSKTESIDTSPIDNAVSGGVEKINEAASMAIQQIQSATQATQSTTLLNSAANTSSVAASTKQISGIINFSKESKSEAGTVIFSALQIEDANVNLYADGKEFPLAIPPEAIHNKLNMVKNETKLIDRNGAELKCKQVYTVTNIEKNHDGTGYTGGRFFLEFEKVPDLSTLSQLTLTYAFEGYDPVTVTLDIPIQ